MRYSCYLKTIKNYQILKYLTDIFEIINYGLSKPRIPWISYYRFKVFIPILLASSKDQFLDYCLSFKASLVEIVKACIQGFPYRLGLHVISIRLAQIIDRNENCSTWNVWAWWVLRWLNKSSSYSQYAHKSYRAEELKEAT